MAFTSVVTKALNDSIGASGWNTYIRDNINWLYNNGRKNIGCSLRRSTSTSFNTGATTWYSWDIEDVDTDAFHSTVSALDRVTIPANQAGIYYAELYVNFFNNWATSQMNIAKNGIAQTRIGMNQTFDTVSWMGPLAVGDYLTAGIYNGGSTLSDVANGSATTDVPLGPLFSVWRVS